MTTTRDFLKELRHEIEGHPATNHLFLNRLATSPFSREDYRVFSENHFPLVCVFTSYLESLLVRAPDSEAKLWLAKVLVDEYGEGSQGDDHSTLYARWLASCGGDPEAVRARRVPPAAHAFIETHRQIVRTRPFLVGLGAVGPGHEWAIPRMFAAVIPGLRRAGFSEKEIGYFTLHVDQDEDHGSWLEEALARSANTEEGRRQVREGALLSLEARSRFWDGVQSAVIRWRQPRTVRQEGPEGRSIAHELLLTGWDRLPLARSLEDRVRSLASRRRPTLEALIRSTRELG